MLLRQLNTDASSESETRFRHRKCAHAHPELAGLLEQRIELVKQLAGELLAVLLLAAARKSNSKLSFPTRKGNLIPEIDGRAVGLANRLAEGQRLVMLQSAINMQSGEGKGKSG